ncbi:hypothetical protein [Nonomuraea sp. NPDC050783]|uniref:hypothetical protein n=1 Tax=Nonomuraea sp. NPDC050783 TaxID=3154634 RepID=UPI0034663979
MERLIDQLLSADDFRTRYTRRIAAEPAQVWAALHAVTHDELPVTRLLMAARSAGRTHLSGPILQTGPIPLLGRQEAREVTAGKVAKFWRLRPTPGPDSTTTPEGFAAFAEPGWVKAAMSFQLSPLPDGRTLLAAETRVHATDAAARRAFAPYWLLIRTGGAGFIRFEMLRAIAHRAERSEQDNSSVQHSQDPGSRP